MSTSLYLKYYFCYQHAFFMFEDLIFTAVISLTLLLIFRVLFNISFNENYEL